MKKLIIILILVCPLILSGFTFDQKVLVVLGGEGVSYASKELSDGMFAVLEIDESVSALSVLSGGYWQSALHKVEFVCGNLKITGDFKSEKSQEGFFVNNVKFPVGTTFTLGEQVVYVNYANTDKEVLGQGELTVKSVSDVQMSKKVCRELIIGSNI